MPLTRVNDVSFDITFRERIMRYGTLFLLSASEQDGVVLRRMPRPQWFRVEVCRQVDDARRPGVPDRSAGAASRFR